MEKARRARAKNKAIEINLKVTYGKCVAKACGNIFKLQARKKIFGVVLSESLKSFGITVIAPFFLFFYSLKLFFTIH